MNKYDSLKIAFSLLLAIALSISGVMLYEELQPDMADREKVKAWAHQTYGEDRVDKVVVDNLGGASIILENGTLVEYPGDANVTMNVSGEVVG